MGGKERRGMYPCKREKRDQMRGAYLNLQVNWWHPRDWLGRIRQEGGGVSRLHGLFTPHHSRLQDVATPTILAEQPLVQVHGDI